MGFAKQLEEAHVSTKPLHAKDLSEEAIAERIEEMLSTYDEKKKNVELLSEKIRSEGGVEEAVRLISELI